MDEAPDGRGHDGHHHHDGHCGHGWHGWGGPRFPVWGLFIFLLGLGWFAGEAGWWDFQWSYAGPLAIMFVGLGMLMGWARRQRRSK